jgi:ABC-2 type transport system ATP-binding protein
MVPSTPMAALEWNGVSKRFEGRPALNELRFAVPEGAAVGLLGPNGAGKTTALRLALGFCRPDAGVVRLHGERPEEPAARRGVGYLPERLVLPERTGVESFLRLHARLAGLEGGDVAAEVDAVLERTGLAQRRHDPCGDLSKGLAQRVGFAQALLGAPTLLVLDEPTTGLDPLGVRDAREWIQAARERGATLLISSHVLSEVERTCDHVVILHEGRIAASGRVEAVLAPGEGLEDAFVRLVRPGPQA